MTRKDKVIATLANCAGFGDPVAYYDELLALRAAMLGNAEFTSLVSIIEAIGNSERLLILQSLVNKDRCVCELEALLQKTQGAVSHHLKILEDAGLVRGWKKGKFTHYSVVRDQLERLHAHVAGWLDGGTNWFGTP